MEDVEMQESGTTTSKKPNLGYCWTHGSSRSRRHTSMTCNDKHPDHQDAATYANPMGGSTEVQRTNPMGGSTEFQRTKKGGSTKVNQGTRPTSATTPRSYCWTHGFSKNFSHTSMTCIKKNNDHQDEATATNKMGGSNRHEEDGQLHQILEQ